MLRLHRHCDYCGYGYWRGWPYGGDEYEYAYYSKGGAGKKGPGKKKTTKGGKFTKSRRKGLEKEELAFIPGPGMYD